MITNRNSVDMILRRGFNADTDPVLARFFNLQVEDIDNLFGNAPVMGVGRQFLRDALDRHVRPPTEAQPCVGLLFNADTLRLFTVTLASVEAHHNHKLVYTPAAVRNRLDALECHYAPSLWNAERIEDAPIIPNEHAQQYWVGAPGLGSGTWGTVQEVDPLQARRVAMVWVDQENRFPKGEFFIWRDTMNLFNFAKANRNA